jgi:hypothetical protein
MESWRDRVRSDFTIRNVKSDRDLLDTNLFQSPCCRAETKYNVPRYGYVSELRILNSK